MTTKKKTVIPATSGVPTERTTRKTSEQSQNLDWWLIFGVVLLCSVVTRLYKVDEPDHICWDETHFGKMGSWYINRTFFFDVHPPLGKMLIALSGYLTGYDGSFPFEKPGDKYGDVNYLGMRIFCTLLGTMIVPFGFLTVWEMTKSLQASFLTAVLLICDVGTITLTQYILLDPILLFFMMGAIYGSAKFQSCSDRAFSFVWWAWLNITGIFLACTISVKFVGLFIFIYVGLRTIAELWTILKDLSKPFIYTVHHFLARFMCLIVLPAILYTGFFYIHLTVLNRSGNGDGFFSSAFQSQLRGNSLFNASMPRQVAYGAIITLKNHRAGGAYLHSHWHLYPKGLGARQQQITTYSHKDENNRWLIKTFDNSWMEENGTGTVRLVKHGDLIRLEHIMTRRNVHSHREPAPVTKKHNQVTGYGENGTGDANDVWKVLIVGGKDGDVVNTVSSKLKFVHYLQHCILTTTNKQLPKWGFEQQEVTCNPNLRDKNSLWNVEDNVFGKLPNVSFEVYAPNFLERFIESHAVMFQGNAGLKPKEGEITSKPWQWPINYKGQFFSGNNYRIYLLGNPIIWWGNMAFLGFFLLTYLYNAIRRQRGKLDHPPGYMAHTRGYSVHEGDMLTAATWLFVGWLLHYVPFWAMGRVLYFHHYFPAHLFSSMLTGIVFSYLTRSIYNGLPQPLNTTLYHTLIVSLLSSVLVSFYLFSPLTYGMTEASSNEPNSTLHSLKWLESWEF
uniref:Protein O-mannosyl-transferase 2 n=1 Tax=Cacopsylla melanoneura TaxID=428564 RepID=A0A8D8ZZ10_9HEMI